MLGHSSHKLAGVRFTRYARLSSFNRRLTIVHRRLSCIHRHLFCFCRSVFSPDACPAVCARRRMFQYEGECGRHDIDTLARGCLLALKTRPSFLPARADSFARVRRVLLTSAAPGGGSRPSQARILVAEGAPRGWQSYAPSAHFCARLTSAVSCLHYL